MSTLRNFFSNHKDGFRKCGKVGLPMVYAGAGFYALYYLKNAPEDKLCVKAVYSCVLGTTITDVLCHAADTLNMRSKGSHLKLAIAGVPSKTPMNLPMKTRLLSLTQGIKPVLYWYPLPLAIYYGVFFNLLRIIPRASNKWVQFGETFACAFVAEVLEFFIYYPIEVLKTRWQVDPSAPKGMTLYESFKKYFPADSGGKKSKMMEVGRYYPGWSYYLGTIACLTAIQFALFDFLETTFCFKNGKTAWLRFGLCSAVAGVVAAAVTNFLETKTVGIQTGKKIPLFSVETFTKGIKYRVGYYALASSLLFLVNEGLGHYMGIKISYG